MTTNYSTQIEIQVMGKFSKQWCRLQTVRFNPEAKANKRDGKDIVYCYSGAIAKAKADAARWSSSDQFIDRSLRVVEIGERTREIVQIM